MRADRLRPRLVVVWALLAALIVAIVVIERTDLIRSQPAEEDGHGDRPVETRWLLPAPIEQIGTVEVAHAGMVHRFERDANGAWFYHGSHTGQEGSHEHQPDPATAAKIEHALTGFGRARIERTFPLDSAAQGIGPMERESTPDLKGRDYGVTVPSMIVLVYAPGQPQPLMQYAVGDLAPDGLSRYVLPVGRTTVVTIADYQITNLLDLLAALSTQPSVSTAGAGASGTSQPTN